MKTNLFLVQTEYHLLLAIHLASTMYNGSDEKNIIVVFQTERRLKNIVKLYEIDNISFIYHQNTNSTAKQSLLKNIKCDKFIFFQENSLFNQTLIYHLKKQYKTLICLAPDGYKPYAVYQKKHELLSMIRDTFDQYKRILKEGIFPKSFYWSKNYQYASSKFLDEIYLTNPESFTKNKNHKNLLIKTIPEFKEKSLVNAGKIFNVKDNKFPIIHNGIYYFNQPFKEFLVETEINFLKELHRLHPKKIIYINLHPLTTEKKKNRYLSLKGIEIIEAKIPAELFILNLKNFILFTGWSTVLITNNLSCNLYFNLPIYKNKGSKALDQSNLRI